MNYDDISIGIQANANAANTALDSLVSRLTAVSVAIHNVNTGGFQGLANGVSMLGNAMSSMKSSGVTSADFSRLATNLNKLASVNTAGIAGLAGSISQIGASIANIPGATEAAASIGSLGNALAVFSYKKVDTAIANMPRIAQAFTEMMGSLSNAPAVSENLINTANALANVASQANGVKSLANTFSGINRPATQSSNILKTFISNLFNTNNGAKSLKGGIDSLAASFGKFYASCFLIIRAMKSLGSAIKSAMDYVETFNYFNVTMNKIGSQFSGDFKKYGYNSAKAYADSFRTTMDSLTTKMTGFKVGENGTLDFSNSKNLGLDVQAIQNYEAQVSAVTNSVGLMGETSKKAATALTMLAADYSSLRNLDLSEVMTNFNSGLIGQSRALYKYGIDITNATLQTYAYKYGITTAVSEMTQADKMQLRLAAILDQSRIAWGDQANTINSVANQYRIMKAQVSNLARTIGSLFIPLLQAVLPYINAFLIALQHLAMWFGKLIGIDFAKNMDGISQAYGGGTDALDGLSDAGDDATDSLNGTNSAAKKLQKTILGFDEINALSDNSDTSSGTGKGKGAGGIDLSGPIGDLLDEYNKAWDDAFKKMQNRAQQLANKLMDYFRRGDYYGLGKAISNWIKKGLDSINWPAIYKGADKFGKGFAEFLNGLFQPSTFYSVGKTIAGALNTALHLAFSFGSNFDFKQFGKAIASGINGFFQNYDFTLLGQTLAVWAKGIWTAIGSALANLSWKDVFKAVGDFFSGLGVEGTIDLLGLLLFVKWIPAAFKAALATLGDALPYVVSNWLSSKIAAGAATTAATDAASTGIIASIKKSIANASAWLAANEDQIKLSSISPMVSIVPEFVFKDMGTAWAAATAGQKFALGSITATTTVVAAIVGWQVGNKIGKTLAEAMGDTEAIDFYVNFNLHLQEVWNNSESVLGNIQDMLDGWVAMINDFENNPVVAGLGTWISTVIFGPLGTIGINLESDFSKAADSSSKSAASISTDMNTISTSSGTMSTQVNTNTQGMMQGLANYGSNVSSASNTVSGANAKISSSTAITASGVADNVTTMQNKYGELWNSASASSTNVSSSNSKMSSSANVTASNVTTSGNMIMQSYSNVGTTASNASGNVSNFYNTAKNTGNTASNVNTFANQFVDAFKKIADAIKDAWDKLTGFNNTSVNVKTTSTNLGGGAHFATGGYPETGSLFYANEFEPELIGNIGNKTAVVNNSQIVEAVSQGVSRAVANTLMSMGSSSNNSAPVVEVVVKATNETLYRAVKQGEADYNGRYHVVTEV